jgi:predicted enzyme related to lactoylglutathione lyase
LSSGTVRSAAVLEVSDVVASAAYYRDILGFYYNRFWGEPPCFCIVRRGTVTIFLDQSRTQRKIPLNQYWAAYVYVDDVEAAYAELKQRGAEIAREFCTMEHGCREFDVRDADGHILGIGQDLSPGALGPGL